MSARQSKVPILGTSLQDFGFYELVFRATKVKVEHVRPKVHRDQMNRSTGSCVCLSFPVLTGHEQ